jgi:hypothetical protein
MVGGRRRNPRARQGADVKIGPAARNSFSRMPGSWFGIAGSRRIRGWQGVRPVCQIGVHRDQHLVLDLAALIRGFWTPALFGTWCEMRGPAFESLPRRKPRGARAVIRRELWGFEGRGRSAGFGAGGEGGESRRYGRRRRACLIARVRGKGPSAARQKDVATL